MGMAVEDIIEERRKRRAFAASRHVSLSKIRDDGNAELRGKHCALARLPSCSDSTSEIFGSIALMIDSLTVTADQLGFNAGVPLKCVGECIGIEVAQTNIEPGKIGDAGGVGVHGSKHGLADCSRIFLVFVGE